MERMSNYTSSPAASGAGLSEETVVNVLEGVYISIYIILCLMVAVVAVLALGLVITTARRWTRWPTFSRPSPLGFLNGGFMGSLFFRRCGTSFATWEV